MLHVPRQPERARRARPARSSGERCMVPEAQAAGKNADRRRALGTFRRRHLVGADHRRQARPRVRRHRQHLQRAGAADRRCDRRVRSRERRDQVDQAADRRRRLRLPGRQRELWRKGGPDFDLGTPPMLVTLPDGRDVIVAGTEIGQCLRDRSRQGRARCSGSITPGEGSIWGGIQWGAAVDGDRAYFPVSDIRTPKPGGLHAVKPGDRRSRVVRAAAAARAARAARAAAPR